MCSLCGIFMGRGHWTDPASNPEVFDKRLASHTWGRERQQRTRLVNRVLAPHGLKLSAWSGGAYMLRSATGQSALVDTLSQLWPAAEQLSGKQLDPLDDGWLAALSGAKSEPLA